MGNLQEVFALGVDEGQIFDDFASISENKANGNGIDLIYQQS